MLGWDDFRFVLALHRSRSLKGAAQELGIDQATVGRRIYALEDELRTQLFEKRSDGFFLTTSGERILLTLEQIETSFLSIDRKLAGLEEKVEGLIRIAAPGALASLLLIPKLPALQKRHPNLEIHLLTGPEVLNLARREADLAIRLVRPEQRDLVVKKIGEMELALYAPANLLKDLGTPKRLEDLSRYPFIGLLPDATSRAEEAILARIGEPRYFLRTDSWSKVLEGIQAGLGIGILPSFMESREPSRDPSMKRLSLVEPERSPIWMALHPDIQKSAKVRVVTEFLTELFGRK